MTCTHLYLLLTHVNHWFLLCTKKLLLYNEEQLSKNTQIKYDSEAVSRLIFSSFTKRLELLSVLINSVLLFEDQYITPPYFRHLNRSVPTIIIPHLSDCPFIPFQEIRQFHDNPCVKTQPPFDCTWSQMSAITQHGALMIQGVSITPSKPQRLNIYDWLPVSQKWRSPLDKRQNILNCTTKFSCPDHDIFTLHRFSLTFPSCTFSPDTILVYSFIFIIFKLLTYKILHIFPQSVVLELLQSPFHCCCTSKICM